MKIKLKKGDTVKVLLGKDRGKTGKIQKVLPKKGSVLVAGVNVYKKHIKAQKGRPGGIVELPRPLLLGKVALVCPACGKPTRVGFQLKKRGEKTRICKKCKGAI